MRLVTSPGDEDQYRLFIAQFEAAAIPKDAWHHAEHVAVAVWYLAHHEEPVAIATMREGLLKLTAAYGIPQTPDGGYHETWTVFFMKVLKQHLERDAVGSRSLVERLHSALGRLEDFQGLTRQYYSSARINSWEARTTWLPPDLREL